MDFYDYYEEYGYPFTGEKRRKLNEFLGRQGLEYDNGIDFTVTIYNQAGQIAATGSMEKNIIKCLAVSCKHQGNGFLLKIISHLKTYAYNQNYKNLLLYTKPVNQSILSGAGFYTIALTEKVLLMESEEHGIDKYLKTLPIQFTQSGDIGAIVLNANPFTRGHQYLVEFAANCCDGLYVFVVEENKSEYSFEDRFDLVLKGTKHIHNVVVCPSSHYMISRATFPTYFLKSEQNAEEANSDLDLTVFGEYFASYFGIKKRFIGTEPYCSVTKSYNLKMKELLPEYGVSVIEVPRFEVDENSVSASSVRELWKEKQYDKVRKLVPESTFEFLQDH